MRYREKNRVLTSKEYIHDWYWPTRAKYAFSLTELATRTAAWQRMYDVETSGFHRIRNKGGIICSPMYSEEVTFSADHTTMVLTGTDYGVPVVSKTWSTVGLASTPYAQLDESTMWEAREQFSRVIDLAVMRAHAAVDVSEINLWASVGELPETIAWVLSLSKRLKDLTQTFLTKRSVAKVIDTLKQRSFDHHATQEGRIALKKLESYLALLEKRKLRRPPKQATQLSDVWLEWRYAVRPLISDIQNGIAAIEKILEAKRFTARGAEVNKGESVSYESLNGYPTPALDAHGVRVKVVDKERISSRAGCLFSVDTQVTNMLDVLGIDQPLEAVYELIPFSFMLDWVFGLGDYLNAIFKSSGLYILTSWSVLQVEHSQSRIIVGSVFGQPKDSKIRWTDQQHVYGSSYTGIKQKWRLPNPPFPSLPPPDLKIDLGKLIDVGTIGKNILAGRSVQVAKRS